MFLLTRLQVIDGDREMMEMEIRKKCDQVQE